MGKMKDELNKCYGDLIVIAYTEEREPSNGCVKWMCMCKHCGAFTIRNGNRLRFTTRATCQVCSGKAR